MKFSDVDRIVAAQEESITVTIYQPNGTPYLAGDGKTECTMSFLGAESKAYRLIDDAMTRKASKAGRVLSPQENRTLNAERIAAVLTDWRGWENDDGSPAEPTPENAKKLYLKANHIFQQAWVAVHGHADFFGSSSTT